MSTVISIRIRKEVKEELEKAGINVSEEIRKRLEDLAWQVRIKRQIEKWNMILAGMKPSREGFSVGSVREDREGH
ncbi:MAG: VapB-type antitoxin [Candidatus Bathyarchaeia archaeon]|nr:VapB-type antitoxin [Candidatus Bathyarchaeota archaeon]